MPGPDRQAFVRSLYPIARRFAQATGIPAEVLLAIAAHESNFGNAGGNMLFGIKGPGATYATHEVVNGQRVDMPDSFRTYATPEASFKDFVDLVSHGRYAGAWQHLQQTGDWRGFLRGINQAGYATDPVWGEKIANFTANTIAPLVQAIGPARAEAAELDSPAGGTNVDTSGERPPSEFESPSRIGGSPIVLSPTRSRIKKQLDDARKQLEPAQQRYAKAQADRLDPKALARMEPGEIQAWQAQHNQEVTDANRDLDALQKKIDKLEADDADAQEKEAADEAKAAAGKAKALADAQKAVNKPTPAPTAPGSASEQFIRNADGTWEPNPNYRPPTPRTSRSYEVGGAKYTEASDEAGGFQPLPEGTFDPNTQLTAAQSAQLPISQQNANSSSLSAAAAMLHAQVAKGTMDFNTAKTVFDYIVAQRAPVEEGGKLYDPGRQPSSQSRAFFGLPTREYSAVDAAGFFGQPQLNQYVRGPYPFGAGPMSAEEYRQRQAGTFQGGNAVPAPQPPPQPAPVGPSPQAPQEAAGGFSPFMAQNAPAPQQGRPSFGAPPGYTAEHQMADLAKIKMSLVQNGVNPDVAEKAARSYLGIPTPDTGLGAVA